jgi:LPS-assembly protein
MLGLPMSRPLAIVLTCLCAGSRALGADDGCTPAGQSLVSGAQLEVPTQLLRATAARAPLPESVEIVADRLERNPDGSQVLSAEPGGDIELRWQGHTLRGARLEADANGNLRIDGHFGFEDPAIRLEGEHGSYGASGASALDARFELLQHPGRGEAHHIRQTENGELELDDVRYTTCPKDRADWQLQSRRITLNLEQERGIGRDTQLRLKGVPILYVPWISFPLSERRQTGLLFPTFGTSSRNGVTLTVPWYWNIAPNRDLTLTPMIYSRRGINLGSELRLLERGGAATLLVNLMPHDRLSGTTRDYQRLDAEWRLPTAWRLNIDAANVGDVHYFEDFSQSSQASSTVFLPQRVALSRSTELWRLGAEALQFQTLDETLAALDRPYAQLPRLSARSRIETDTGWRALLQAEAVNFTRSTGITGWRANLQPSVDWELLRPGYYIRPGLAWDYARYQLSGIAPGATATPTRSVPQLTFDAGLQLERTVGRDGGRVVTLEPRLLYVNIPYRDQSALPIFDSGIPDPNFVSLFRTNRYVGGDRLGDASKLAVGVTTRMFASTSGRQYLSATFGQSFNFATPRVTLPQEAPDTSRRSSFIANIDLRSYQKFSLRLDLAWNPELATMDKAQVAVQYREAGNQLLNIGYRFDRGSVKQIDTSGAWPVSKRWDLYGRSIYSLQDGKSLDNFAGLRFRSDCWGLRAVMRRSVSTRSGQLETGVYLQFELTGLSSVGSGADTFLQQSIQGYSATKESRQAQPFEP